MLGPFTGIQSTLDIVDRSVSSKMSTILSENLLYYLPAAGQQIPKITHIAGAVCLRHFMDIASNFGTPRKS